VSDVTRRVLQQLAQDIQALAILDSQRPPGPAFVLDFLLDQLIHRQWHPACLAELPCLFAECARQPQPVRYPEYDHRVIVVSSDEDATRLGTAFDYVELRFTFKGDLVGRRCQLGLQELTCCVLSDDVESAWDA